MSAFKFTASTVGRKFLTGLTGLLLVGFLFAHLGGNLTMLVGPKLFNDYTHHLESLGVLLWIAEIVLLSIFVAHVVGALKVQAEKRRARPRGYAVTASKGGPSRMTLASRSMIVTGLVLLVFLPLHVWMFKFNQGNPSPTMTLNGKEVRDLYRIVLDAFRNPAIAWGYVAVMVLLGSHLRHGFWSALQSLGANNPRWSPLIYSLGLVVAVLLAIGFIVLPIYMCYAAPPHP
jgi:succinate dehydrogenase / fumarate reductase cytochrome b subunit